MDRPVTNDLIKQLACSCAYDAVMQGATAPWGDGDMQPGDLDALAKLLGQKPDRFHLAEFEREFRDGILDYAGES